MGGFFEIFIDNDKWSINLAIEYQFHRGLDHTRWRLRSHMLHPVYTNALRMLDTDVIAGDTRLRHQAMPAYVAGGGLAKEIGQKTTPWGVSCANGFGPRPHSFIFFHLHNKKAAALLLFVHYYNIISVIIIAFCILCCFIYGSLPPEEKGGG